MFVADILKANDEVIRVMALYEDTVHRPDVDSLLVEHRNDASHGQCNGRVWDLYCHHQDHSYNYHCHSQSLPSARQHPSCLLYTSDAADE